MVALVSALVSQPLREQAGDESLDVFGIDTAVTIGVAGAGVARDRIRSEQQVDKGLDVLGIDNAVAVHVARIAAFALAAASGREVGGNGAA